MIGQSCLFTSLFVTCALELHNLSQHDTTWPLGASDLLVAEADLVVVGVLGEHVEVDVVGVFDQEVLEVLDEVGEGGAVDGVDGPALLDDVEELAVAVRGLLEAAAVADELHDLGGRLAGVGRGAWKSQKNSDVYKCERG